jgi:hypothetical protein
MFLLHVLFFPYYLYSVLSKNIVINVVFRLYDVANILTNTKIKFDTVIYHNSLNFLMQYFLFCVVVWVVFVPLF